jgi:hypothetical protein
VGGEALRFRTLLAGLRALAAVCRKAPQAPEPAEAGAVDALFAAAVAAARRADPVPGGGPEARLSPGREVGRVVEPREDGGSACEPRGQ